MACMGAGNERNSGLIKERREIRNSIYANNTMIF